MSRYPQTKVSLYSSSAYVANGRNQYTSVAGATHTHDLNGNLTGDGSRTFGYDAENRLTSVSGSASLTLTYDPLGRLRQTTAGAATTDFLYEGDRLIAEYNGATVLRRYAHGPGVDEPIVWYEGANLTTKRWLHPDERGSIVAFSDGAGAATVYRYGTYGEPAGNDFSGSRFRYTGQIALPEVKLYHYKARVYDPTFGRFLQTDPVGYDDDFNLYAYVYNDPLNTFDPTGNGLVTTAIKFIAKGGDLAATFAGAIDDAKTIINPAVPLPGRIVSALSLASELLPVSARDVKAGAEIVQSVSKVNTKVPDDALVVRGGANITPESIAAGTRETDVGRGFSANSASTVADAATDIPHNQVGVTRAGDIRAAGGQVHDTSHPGNPTHVTVTGLESTTASTLLSPSIPNPVPKCDRRCFK